MPSLTESQSTRRTAVAVELRPYPYPYRALMAICSDLDETPTREVYVESSKYLNTTAQTCMGEGVGLEVGNTIYFDMPQDQFSYWNTDDRGREEVRALIKSGHIDCIHSFGDFADTRAKCERNLNELWRHGCRLEAWIDHAVAPSNFGADIMKGSGDVRGSAVYHADLTTAFGVKYVWRGRVTSVIGQEVPRRLAGIFDPEHAAPSAKTVAKEAAKIALAALGNGKYSIHAANRILRDGQLRDGTPVVEFLRANPYWQGVNRGETATGIADVMSERMLHTLLDREGACILYTHLGKVKDPREPFQAPARAAFERLARFFHDGMMLVATTRRLLGYLDAKRKITFSAWREDERTTIGVLSHGVPSADLSGLTFYVDAPGNVKVNVDGTPVPVSANPADATGRKSVSIPWRRLDFPRL